MLRHTSGTTRKCGCLYVRLEQLTSGVDTLCVFQVLQQVGQAVLKLSSSKVHCNCLVLHGAIAVHEKGEDVAVLRLVQQMPCNSLPKTSSSKGGGWCWRADCWRC